MSTTMESNTMAKLLQVTVVTSGLVFDSTGFTARESTRVCASVTSGCAVDLEYSDEDDLRAMDASLAESPDRITDEEMRRELGLG